MNRSILVVVIVGLAILGVGSYFGMKSGIGKKSGPPTEKEVSDLYEKVYATCIPVKEWEEKVQSLGGGWDGKCVVLGHFTETGAAAVNEACTEWVKGKTECDGLRNVADDHFVSFKKTDGKLTAPSQFVPSEYYTMYGVLTMFHSGKDIEQKVQINFERRETGWVLPSDSGTALAGLWYNYSGPVLEIPR